MSLPVAFEVGRLYKPLTDLADANKDINTAFMMLPGMRAFWPMSAINSDPQAKDLANLNHLDFFGSPQVGMTANAPYVSFVAANSDYLLRGDTADLDIIGTETYITPALRGLTIGGWFWFNSLGSPHRMMGKGVDSSANAQHSYSLTRNGAGSVIFTVTNGTTPTFASTGATLSGTWMFCVGRYMPSVEVSVFVSGSKTINPSSIPASINNSATNFTIGASGTPGVYLDGRASLCFLCAAALPDSVIDNLFQVSRDLFGV